MSYYSMREVEGYAGTRWESEDGKLTVLLSITKHDKKDRHDLMNAWMRNGLFKGEFLETTINVWTEYVDDEGNSYGRFNPTVLVNRGRLINFDRICEDTPANRANLVAECAAMYRDGRANYGYSSCQASEITPDCLAA